MAELLEAVVSWPSLGLIVVVFGFAPGFCLRLIVLAYHRSDPRRAELIAELYVVPRIQRPLWVAEQLEVALFEGLRYRVSAAVRRLADRRRARARTDKRGVSAQWVAVVGTLFTGVSARIDGRTEAVVEANDWLFVLCVCLAIASALFIPPLSTAWRRLRRPLDLRRRRDRTR